MNRSTDSSLHSTVPSAPSLPAPEARATARGRAYEVRRSPVHGNGVFATRRIPEGTRILEYKGERTSWKKALKREAHDPDNPYHTFFFSLDDGRVIDGGVQGNAARWINHSCDPNCEASEDDDNRVFIHALRDIEAGEELNYDYGLVVDERRTPALKRAYGCRCGAGACRGTMLDLSRRPGTPGKVRK
jgi:SET domain-containing protein